MDAIGKLTGGIAHDFNNLLAAVLGGIGLIERRAKLGDEDKKILAMTKRAADQGSELVGRLLAFARRQQLQPACIDIRALAQTVTELLAPMLGGLVTLEWKFDQAPWCAFADQSQLELALINLIINARDALDGGGTIVIAAENRIDRRRRGERARARRLSGARRGRPRLRNLARQHRESDGAVLHHQGRRQRHRPRIEHGLRLRQPVRRGVPPAQHGRARHAGRDLAAARRRSDRGSVRGLRASPRTSVPARR